MEVNDQYNLVLKSSTYFTMINSSCSWTWFILVYPTTVLNPLLIISMAKSREINGPYGRLNLSLAVTDLLTRLFDMPLFYMVFRFIAEGKNPCLYNSVDVATFFYPFVYTSKLCKRSIAVGVIISWDCIDISYNSIARWRNRSST